MFPKGFQGTIPIAGEIRGLTIPWLFEGLHTGKKTGTVIFARDTQVKKVFFSQGELIFATSNQREDWLGELLLRTGAISKEQFDESSKLVIKTGKKQGGVLVELGYLTPKGLVTGVKAQVEHITVSLFAWRDGYYILDESPLPAYDIIPLQMSIGDLIIEGLRGAQWDKSLFPLNAIVRPVSNPSLLFQRAELDHDQRKVLSLVDGSKSIEEICCFSGIGDPNTLSALSVLLALRMAEVGEIKNEEDKKFVCQMVAENIPLRSDTEPAVLQTSPGEISIQSLADIVTTDDKKPENAGSGLPPTKEEVQDAYDSLELQNFYEMLGVNRTTSAMGIKNAYFTLIKRYHPDQHFSPAMSELEEKLNALKNAFDEAYETLIDKNKRERYNLDLSSGVKKHINLEGAQMARPASKKTAEDYFEEGMKLYNEGDYWSAEESFQGAVGLDPRGAQYLFYRGLALSHMPRRGREAEEFFVRAAELAPANVGYNLELGNFYAKYGLKAKALSVYRDALKYDPKSEKIKEAIKKVGV
jgi:hypothetical protein